MKAAFFTALLGAASAQFPTQRFNPNVPPTNGPTDLTPWGSPPTRQNFRTRVTGFAQVLFGDIFVQLWQTEDGYALCDQPIIGVQGNRTPRFRQNGGVCKICQGCEQYQNVYTGRQRRQRRGRGPRMDINGSFTSQELVQALTGVQTYAAGQDLIQLVGNGGGVIPGPNPNPNPYPAPGFSVTVSFEATVDIYGTSVQCWLDDTQQTMIFASFVGQEDTSPRDPGDKFACTDCLARYSPYRSAFRIRSIQRIAEETWIQLNGYVSANAVIYGARFNVSEGALDPVAFIQYLKDHQTNGPSNGGRIWPQAGGRQGGNWPGTRPGNGNPFEPPRGTTGTFPNTVDPRSINTGTFPNLFNNGGPTDLWSTFEPSVEVIVYGGAVVDLWSITGAVVYVVNTAEGQKYMACDNQATDLVAAEEAVATLAGNKCVIGTQQEFGIRRFTQTTMFSGRVRKMATNANQWDIQRANGQADGLSWANVIVGGEPAPQDD